MDLKLIKREGLEGVKDEDTGLQFGFQKADRSWCAAEVSAKGVTFTVPAGEAVWLSLVVPVYSVPYEVDITWEGGEQVGPPVISLDASQGEQVALVFSTTRTAQITAHVMQAQAHEAPMEDGPLGGAPADFVRNPDGPAFSFAMTVLAQ